MSSLITFTSLFKSCVELFERFARFCRTIVNIWPRLRSLSRFHQHLRLTVDILIFDIVDDVFMIQCMYFQVQVPREDARGRDDEAFGVPERVHRRPTHPSRSDHRSMARLRTNSVHHSASSHQCKQPVFFKKFFFAWVFGQHIH